MTVRIGRPTDVDEMMTLAKAACEDNAMFNPSELKLLQEIWSSLNQHQGVIGIIGDPIEAAIMLRVDSMWYSDEMSLIERAIFVHPDFRAARGGRARELCEWAKKAADELKMTLTIGIITDKRAAGKIRLYQRQFGEPAGGIWIYRPPSMVNVVNATPTLQ